ncbi:hypothetical protein AAGS61_08615 [Lysinibacillus sp. KU-BSD001]|uniref:hypothetical protein n=1 Tax=Lysinibacillus sp. KU-BSD001 TaxID=3141328 RepID=UPI0036E73A5D
MDNLNIYEIIGLHDDPVYQKLEQLQPDDEILIDAHTVRLTDKFYEVENDDVHLGFKDKIGCYQFLSWLLVSS